MGFGGVLDAYAIGVTSLHRFRPRGCYNTGMDHEELLPRVRALRSRGSSPKQIARALGVRPAQVTPLIRAIAREQASAAPGLAVDDAHGWPDRPECGMEASGLAAVLVAREGRRGRGKVSVCGYLVDTYCLGVKDALGPRAMDEAGLRRFVQRYFDGFDGEPVEAPIDLARHLVWGAVEYARGLGFEPARDFEPTRDHLGPLDGPAAIGFGRHGKPFYMERPYDDADRIMRVLHERVGRDNFHFVTTLPGEAVGRQMSRSSA
jgi:hypothetical protein